MGSKRGWCGGKVRRTLGGVCAMLVKIGAGQDGRRSCGVHAAGGGVRSRGFVKGAIVPWVVAIGAVGVSAIVTKEMVVKSGAKLEMEAEARVVDVGDGVGETVRDGQGEVSDEAADAFDAGIDMTIAEMMGPPIELMSGYVEPMGPAAILAGGFVPDAGVRWFDGRPAKPSRVVWMTVTAYSPDPRSCGDSADGITATLHCVTTNGHQLVAADPKVLPYGSMLTIPGYAIGAGSGKFEPAIVPVLDCGGAIKGQRLDVLFPTHEEAVAWGIRELPVTVWKYADGGEMTNPRRVR